MIHAKPLTTIVRQNAPTIPEDLIFWEYGVAANRPSNPSLEASAMLVDVRGANQTSIFLTSPATRQGTCTEPRGCNHSSK